MSESECAPDGPLLRPTVALFVQLRGLVLADAPAEKQQMEKHLGMTQRDAVDYLLYAHDWGFDTSGTILGEAKPDRETCEKGLQGYLKATLSKKLLPVYHGPE